MKEVSQEKYIGDFIHCLGNPESDATTVMARNGLTVSAIYEIKSVLEDCRVNLAGGLCAGLDKWKLSVLTFLLNNCSTWVGIPKGNDLQTNKCSILFATAISTPIPALLWETGGLTMENGINIYKLSF